MRRKYAEDINIEELLEEGGDIGEAFNERIDRLAADLQRYREGEQGGQEVRDQGETLRIPPVNAYNRSLGRRTPSEIRAQWNAELEGKKRPYSDAELDMMLEQSKRNREETEDSMMRMYMKHAQDRDYYLENYGFDIGDIDTPVPTWAYGETTPSKDYGSVVADVSDMQGYTPLGVPEELPEDIPVDLDSLFSEDDYEAFLRGEDSGMRKTNSAKLRRKQAELATIEESLINLTDEELYELYEMIAAMVQEKGIGTDAVTPDDLAKEAHIELHRLNRMKKRATARMVDAARILRNYRYIR